MTGVPPGDRDRNRVQPGRRRTTVVVAAVAVAVIASTVVLVGHRLGGSGDSSSSTTSEATTTPSATSSSTPSATPSPTPSPTPSTDPTPTSQPAPGVLDVSDLRTGRAPGMGYVTGGDVLHQVEGSTLDVGTRHPVVGFASTYDGSTVWQTSDGQQPFIEVQDASGHLQPPVASGWGLAVNVAHTAAAWVRPDGQVMLLSTGSKQPTPLGDPITAGADLRMGAVIGTCSGPSGCTVYVNVADAQGASSWQPWEVTASGSQRLLDGGFLSVSDQTESGLTIGYTKVSSFGTCSKLAGGGEFRGWSTCRHTLVSFSPDGSLVLADPAYHDGIGNGVIGMYDVGAGDLLFQRRSDEKHQSFYPSAQWEDDTHVLAPVFQDGRWAIVRFAADGSMEYAVPPVKGDAEHNPFTFAIGGMSYGD